MLETLLHAVLRLFAFLLRVERYDNSQLLDWRTISTDSAEVVGQMLWWIAALLLLAGIWSYLDGKT